MKRAVRFLALAALLLLSSVALAGPSAPYELSWWTVDGGGETVSSGGDYGLGGTIGQPDAGAANGGDYALEGGFWGGAVVECRVYLPLVLR